MNPTLNALVIATAAVLASPAQASTDAQLQAIVEQRLQGDRTGACFAVAVIDGGVSRAYVCANAAQTGRIDANTAFEIGSVSKTMTAALLADLIGQGKASLDDPLSAWLPEGTRVPEFQGQPILIRHVVSHTSGLPALPPGVPIVDPNDPYAAVDAAMLFAALERSTLDAAPGTAFAYSNFASMLLSEAVARRAGTDFESLLGERLFTPLGMRGAYVNTRPEGIRAAVGHLPNGKPTPPWNFKTDLAGVGGVRATLDDMVRYVQAQLGQPPLPIVSALALSQQPVVPDGQPPMAMNWMLDDINGHTWHAHEGGTGGFSSLVAFDRERGRGVVVLSDTALHSLGGLGSLGLHLADASQPLGKPRKAVPAPGELIDALVGEYTLQGGMAMALSRDGDALAIQATGQPRFRMGYDDAGDFYPLDFDALLKPQRKADGSHGFTWLQMGGAAAAVRTGGGTKPALPMPAPDQLARYAGDYPLMPGFVLKVFVKDSALHIQGTGQPALPTTVVAADVFAVDQVGAEFRFERDEAGEVSAVTLLQGGQTLRGEKQ
ncbi:MAG: serine hydrolase [Arenimonas sp.]|uniref:serine hydrolase n=1 Tax=Arenimonas sp. TaxID=1872635 RepID=UPI0025C3DEE2|nr:serine hydrolase [Arenimonas sp.]MBW8367411.1 serine hydrolase [Arenimonas sp.]